MPLGAHQSETPRSWIRCRAPQRTPRASIPKHWARHARADPSRSRGCRVPGSCPPTAGKLRRHRRWSRIPSTGRAQANSPTAAEAAEAFRLPLGGRPCPAIAGPGCLGDQLLKAKAQGARPPDRVLPPSFKGKPRVPPSRPALSTMGVQAADEHAIPELPHLFYDPQATASGSRPRR